jgi:hypothetical protein
MTKSILLNVSQEYTNEELDKLLSLQSEDVNEFILSTGSSMYLNQGKLIKDLNPDKDSKELYYKKTVSDLQNQLKELKELNNKIHDELRNELFEEQKRNLTERSLHINKIRDEYTEENKKLVEANDKLTLSLKQHQADMHKYLLEEEEKTKKLQEEYKQKIISDHLREVLELKSMCEEATKTVRSLEKERETLIAESIEKGKELTKPEYEKLLAAHERRIQELNGLVESLLTNKTNDTLVTKLDEMKNDFNKFFKDNSAKGTFGENKIEYYLSQNFSGCQIEDTSSTTASGDFLFKYESLKLMVESKNVQYLKNSEIDKFYRDIDLQVSKNAINSALFISFHDTNLPQGYRNFFFEMRSGIPVIFISNVLNSDFYMKNSILMLMYLVKNGITNKLETDDDKLQFVVSAMYKVADFVTKQAQSIENERKLIEKLSTSNNERKQHLISINDILETVFRKYPDLDSSCITIDTNSSDTRFELLIDLICEKKKEQPTFVLKLENIYNIEAVKENNFTNNALKTYTIKKIKEAVEARCKEE